MVELMERAHGVPSIACFNCRHQMEAWLAITYDAPPGVPPRQVIHTCPNCGSQEARNK